MFPKTPKQKTSTSWPSTTLFKQFFWMFLEVKTRRVHQMWSMDIITSCRSTMAPEWWRLIARDWWLEVSLASFFEGVSVYQPKGLMVNDMVCTWIPVLETGEGIAWIKTNGRILREIFSSWFSCKFTPIFCPHFQPLPSTFSQVTRRYTPRVCSCSCACCCSCLMFRPSWRLKTSSLLRDPTRRKVAWSWSKWPKIFEASLALELLVKSGVSKNCSKADRAVIRERSSKEAASRRGWSFSRTGPFDWLSLMKDSCLHFTVSK